MSEDKQILHIQPEIVAFMEEAIPLAVPSWKEITAPCPFCKMSVRYPLVAREGDLAAFQQIISLAEEWLKEKGVMGMMFKDILAKLHANLCCH